ncbi:NADH dehydrogenase [ubiquinone] 1 alpha subcomplex subunit 11 [Xiphophorus hellerii]|uniref:NADH dehydrogenase [ubiquinone] 1 alpha subcomplex subunit 11 n=1 Tax=Xiphophorus hellerii TaxID=8084 RepID=UPI0013B3C079|nr:NADH dehydrogenase [ubiquinone] 1 alpha subcomplex subunit 11 [Xiphophorus hellerii]
MDRFLFTPVGGSTVSTTGRRHTRKSFGVDLAPPRIVMGYWDVPEGTDCVEKTWIATKLGTALGLIGSAYHIVAFQPDTALEAVQRAASATVTMATMGAIFGMTTCLTAQAREAPDDPLNYFVGGCASGIFLGARTHNAMTGTTGCLALGTLAFFTKVGKMEGWRLTGPPKL